MMNRTVAIVVIVIAVVLLGAGLLFLCAATREPSRLLLAGALIVVGGGLAAWGGTTLRRLRDLDPENLSDRITALARAGDAEVTLSQAVAELGVPDEAAVAAFNLLERRGQAHRERRGEREFYVFPGLQPSKVTRKCPYCGGEFSVKTPVYKCPHCGGDLRLVKE
jgi:DNA-directed RNA polymerase subunit RPC12/RpoP